MNLKKATVYFIILTLIVIAVWDAYVIIEQGTEASISHTLVVWSYEYPAVTFLMGFTMGHLFWRMRDTKETKRLTRGDE
jgi:hypothetical protein